MTIFSRQLGKSLALSLGVSIFTLFSSSSSLGQTKDARELVLQNRFSAHQLNGESQIKVRHSTSSERFLTAASDGRLKVWIQPGVLYEEFVEPGHTMIFNARFINDEQFATATYSGVVGLWGGENVRLPSSHLKHLSAVTDIAILPMKKGMVTASDDGSIRYWSRSGELVKRIRRPGVSRFITQADRRGLIAVTQDVGTVTLLNLQGDIIKTKQTSQGRLNAISFNTNETLLATGGFDGSIKIWSIAEPSISLELMQTIPAVEGAGWIQSLAFNQSGLLASASDDGILRIWSSQGRLVAKQKISNHHLVSLSFDRSGKNLLTAASDGTVSILSLN